MTIQGPRAITAHAGQARFFPKARHVAGFPALSAARPRATIEVAPGILWARLALPFLLDHVNIYFVDDGKGWALIDTGIGDKATQAAWQPLSMACCGTVR